MDTVIVELPELFIAGALKEADAPVGNPPTERFTVPVNPAPPVTETVNGILPPCVTNPGLGETANVKSATVTVTEGG